MFYGFLYMSSLKKNPTFWQLFHMAKALNYFDKFCTQFPGNIFKNLTQRSYIYVAIFIILYNIVKINILHKCKAMQLK